MKRLLCSILLLFFVGGMGLARDETFQSQFDWSMMLWRQGKQEEAFEKLRKMTKIWPDSAVVYNMLGQFKIKQNDYGDAKKWFKKAENLDEKNPEVQYYLGICRRELSLHKPPIVRQLEMKKSRKHFEKVIDRYPDFKDVWYQFALLDKYKRHYKDAVIKAEKQVQLKPGVSHVVVGTHWLYDIFLEHKKSEEWLLKQQNARADFFLADLYRRQEKFRQADSILQNLLHSNPGYLKIPALLSYARMYSQQNKPEKLQRSFSQAIHSLQNAVEAAFLFQDIKFVMTDQELDYYLDLNNLADVKHFFRLFWKRRDPTPAADLNFRLIEHYRRLCYAEAFYRYDGERTWFNNPDKDGYLQFPRVFNLNRTFNDKGLVYIRHGKPDDFAADVGEQLPLNESWLYYQTGSNKKLIFHFFVDENATGNNWRLNPGIPRALVFSRINWDKIFNRIYSAGYLDYVNIRTEMMELSKQDVLVGLNSDRHTWSEEIEPISFPFYLSSFKGDSGQVRCEVYYGFSRKDVFLEQNTDAKHKEIEFGFKAMDNRFNDIYQVEKKIEVADIDKMTDSLGLWIDQVVFHVDTSQHLFSLYLEGLDDNQKGGYTFRYRPPVYDNKTPAMSSLELAGSIKPTREQSCFTKKNLSVVPRPNREFDRDNPLYVYFELYNLPVEKNQKISYTLEYSIRTLKKYNQNIFSKIAGLFKKNDEKIFNRVERVGSASNITEYIALDLGSKDPGEYELVVSAKVRGRESETLSKIGFKLL